MKVGAGRGRGGNVDLICNIKLNAQTFHTRSPFVVLAYSCLIARKNFDGGGMSKCEMSKFDF